MTGQDELCARCGGRVEKGMLAVAFDGTVSPVFWLSGELQREALTAGAVSQGRQRIPIVAHRCSKCGRVSSMDAAI